MGLLNPIYDAVSWVMVAFHTLLTSVGLAADSGLAWTLSIVGLVIVIRTLMIPLFVRQIHAQRGLQALQPRMREIQQKFKNDRDRQSQELMKLYKETGTNPLSSCLPLIIQAPIFFGLFHVLNAVSRTPDQPPGVFTRELAESASNATIFGAPLSQTFLGAGTVIDKVIIGVLVIAMSALMFFTQRQLMSKNMPLAAADGGANPFAQQQKLMLYLMPVMFLVSGLGFPLGVLIYWVTSNIWTAAQQFIVIRRNPTPGSQAAVDLEHRRARRTGRALATPTPTTVSGSGSAAPQRRRGGAPGRVPAATDRPEAAPAPGSTPGQRQQPKRTRRGERGKNPASGAAGGAPGRASGAAKGPTGTRRSGQSRPI
jgi:YidC/Oxa1 family membrane protein insertase